MYLLKFGNSFILLLLNAHLCKNIICIVKTSLSGLAVSVAATNGCQTV